MISARAWNSLIDRLRRNQILGVRTSDPTPVTHPWDCRAFWSEQLGSWAVRVRAGYVIGQEVIATVPDAIAPRATLERLAHKRGKNQEVDAWLSEGPALPLQVGDFRRIGSDAVAVDPEPVPAHFAARGVLDAEGAIIDQLDGSITFAAATVSAEALRNQRYLRAVEILLRIPRVYVEIGLDFDTDQSQQVAFNYRQPTGDPYVFARARHDAETDLPPDILPVLSGGSVWADTGHQTVHLATVYLLSPVGIGPGSDPDEAWTAHIRNRVFWNLNHAVEIPDPPDFDTGKLLPTGGYLASGIAAGLLQAIADDINRANASVELVLAAANIESRVWTV